MLYTNATKATFRSNLIRSRTGKPLVLLPGESISLGEADWPLTPVHQRELDRYAKYGELVVGDVAPVVEVIKPKKPRWQPTAEFEEPEDGE